jgi:CRISPR-associated protein Cas5t
MMCLYLEAPFAVCRTFTAGWYRPTAAFLTPSAAYGLILNIAGIESRLREEDAGHDGKTPATLTRPGLPAVRIALGLPTDDQSKGEFPTIESIYQQLHNYPVGTAAGMPKELSKGNKNNITPVRRELLCNLRAVIGIDGNADLESRIRRGLAGEFNSTRYGLPFLGDNQFLLDRLEERPQLPTAQWYEKLDQGSPVASNPGTTRLTVWIDRADMSKTISHLFVPTREPTSHIPEAAWTSICPT